MPSQWPAVGHKVRSAPEAKGLERAEGRARELATEQAALRRVATLIARGTGPEQVFQAVADEVQALLNADASGILRFEADGTVTVTGANGGPYEPGARLELDPDFIVGAVRRTRRAARFDTDDPTGARMPEAVRAGGMRSAVAHPIVVEGGVWGAIVVGSAEGPMPAVTEDRLADFTELVATAVANTDAREQVTALANEQAALRRVATLVAEDVPASELFDAVTREVGTLLGGDYAGMARFEDDTVVTVGVWAADGRHPPVPPRWQMQPGDPATTVAETRGAARWNDWTGVPGPIAEFIREIGIRSTVGTPIIVGGRVWGALALHSKQSAPLAPDTESRMAQFTDLLGTAVANSEARAEVARLADEQAALRRVATLVARDAPREEVFTGIASEIGHLFGLEETRMVRYDEDGTGVVVARSGPTEDFFPVGTHLSVDADTASSRVLRTGEPVRIDDYGTRSGPIAEAVRSMGIRAVVATPISVEGRLWGAIAAGTTQDEPLPPETGTRLGQFTEMMATAVANTESRAEAERLAEEQAALRRVATLVAEGASPSAVLEAVAAEMERALGADAAMLLRYEPDEEVTVVARGVPNPSMLAPGMRVSHEGENVTSMVRRTGRPARIGDYQRARGPVADLARAVQADVHSAVGAPIFVDGRLWGVIIASWGAERSPPDDTEERMVKFAQLLDTATANADSRDQLMASRARLLTAGDEARRRVVRDLHDGAQQRLVHTILTLKLAQRAFEDEDGKAESLLSEALEQAEQGNRELRELAHGILPTVLTHGGLRAGVESVVARLNVPVRVDVAAERLPAEIEASAYFIVAEALTNVVKHSHAERAEVTASLEDGMLRIEVRDNGAGGADPDGHGLLGMRDRVTTLGGRLEVESPAGGGTLVAATLPTRAVRRRSSDRTLRP
jgi:GAF domain-containing protein